MKITLLTTAMAILGYSSYAQNQIGSTGYVGIGTTVPQTYLHVVGQGTGLDDGNQQFGGGGIIIQANPGSRSTTNGAQLEFALPALTDGSGSWGQARIIAVAANINNSDATGKMILGTRRSFNKLGTGPQWYYGNDITIDGSGNVGIGTTSPNTKLSVLGTIHATEVLVDQTVIQTPDYVFDKDYDLTTLKDVKTYIDKNHHLPEIPSAAQVAKDGINLGEMNAKLLKKIEELTLYLIEKDQSDNEKDKLLASQKNQISEQQLQIDQLKAQMKKFLTSLNKE